METKRKFGRLRIWYGLPLNNARDKREWRGKGSNEERENMNVFVVRVFVGLYFQSYVNRPLFNIIRKFGISQIFKGVG